MNGKTILTELGGIDGRFILQASPDAKPKKNTVWRPLALAACLALIVAGGLTGYGYWRAHAPADVQPPVAGDTGDPVDTADTAGALPPDTAGDDAARPHLTLTAQEAGAAFRQVKMMNDAATRSYQKVYAPDVSFLGVSVTEADTLPGYDYLDRGLTPDGAELQSFMDGIAPRLAKATGLSLPSAVTREGLGGWPEADFSAPGCLFFAFQNGNADCLSLSHEDGGVALNGVPVAVDQRLSDEQIIAALESLKRELSAIIGVSLPDIRVSRHYDGWSEHGATWIDILLYDESAHPLNRYLSSPVSDYILLSFDNAENYSGDVVSDDILEKVVILYSHRRVAAETEYMEKDYGPLMGLEEAEEYLRKGWVFGGHSCPLCMAEQEAVTFDTYDAWGLTYITTWNEAGDTATGALPFYVFYKALGQAENGNTIYAQTYVPAVETAGMAEYFEAQARYHEEAWSGGDF